MRPTGSGVAKAEHVYNMVVYRRVRLTWDQERTIYDEFMRRGAVCTTQEIIEVGKWAKKKTSLLQFCQSVCAL